MTPCSVYCQRQTACANRSDTSFRHNRVVCCLCDTDCGSTSCCSTQSFATSDACRLPGVQRCRRLVEVPRTCAKPIVQDNFKQEQLLVAQERKRIQQQKDRDSYYKERHERTHRPKLYKNDLKQAEREVCACKYKSQQNKRGAQQNRRGAQLPDSIHHGTPLSKEEQYAEELRLARISFGQQRKKCAANNPIKTFARIPSIPTAPPTGSRNVTIDEINAMNPDGAPDTKFFTGDVKRNVHEEFQKKEEELRKESMEFKIVRVSSPEPRNESPNFINAESSPFAKITTSMQVIDMAPPTNKDTSAKITPSIQVIDMASPTKEDSKPTLPMRKPTLPTSKFLEGLTLMPPTNNDSASPVSKDSVTLSNHDTASLGNTDSVNPSRRATLKNTSSPDLSGGARLTSRRRFRGDPNNIFSTIASIAPSSINIASLGSTNVASANPNNRRSSAKYSNKASPNPSNRRDSAKASNVASVNPSKRRSSAKSSNVASPNPSSRRASAPSSDRASIKPTMRMRMGTVLNPAPPRQRKPSSYNERRSLGNYW